MTTVTRDPRPPAQDEYDPYYQPWISIVPAGDIVATLRRQPDEARALLGDLTLAQAGHRYAEGKWTVEQVFGHVLDIEWVFTNRVLRIARGDTTSLPGVDHEVMMAGADFTGRLPGLLDQFALLRAASTALYDTFGEAELARRGEASGLPFSVRALLHFVDGHARHHLRVIEERYL